MNEQQLELARDYAWNYFAIHAQQRMQTFNFFILFATLVATGMFASLHKDFLYPVASIFLGLLLTFLSYVFWKLDRRNKMLIENAEKALRHLEMSLSGFAGESIKLIKNDDDAMKGHRLIDAFLGRMVFSYSESFAMVFFAFAVAGMLGIVLGMNSAASVVFGK